MIPELQIAIDSRVKTDNTFFNAISNSYIVTALSNNQTTHVVTLTIGTHVINPGDKVLIASIGGMTSLNGMQAVLSIVPNVSISISITTAQTYTTGGTVKVSKFYYAKAPIIATGKYAIMSDVTNTNFIDTASLVEECYFQIAIFETSTNDISSTYGVNDAAKQLMLLLDTCDKVLSVTGYSVISITRLNIMGPRRTELDNGFLIIINYKIQLERGRQSFSLT